MSTAYAREPYRREHEASVQRGLERGVMPRSIDGLVHWYVGLVAEELPERLHRHDVWHDEPSRKESTEGKRGQGGSLLGSPAWAGLMRMRMESVPWATDEDGYYLFPMAFAVSQLCRRHPIAGRMLVVLAAFEGDWQAHARGIGWPEEVYERFMADALRELWARYVDRDTREARLPV